MVIDDDKDVVITLKTILEQTDDDNEKQGISNNDKSKEFEVDLFNSPEVALSNFKPGQYDLLLLDIVMPQMNGFELHEKLKTIDNKVRVCFITAYEINYHAIRDLFPTSAEVDCFIRKPIEKEELKRRLRDELKQVY